MVATAILISIIADSVAMLILLYIIFSLIKAEDKFVKQHMLKYYEVMKRDKIFRNALGILAFSLALAIAAAVWALYRSGDRMTIDILLAGSGVFRMIFFLYLLMAVKATSR
ncbi:TPA: hypothetical protein HA265_03470 [Candidatus Woesearchaeota archaeon]|nr:hypothetical protein [Candidatus Woesearchaeota archaeon]